MVFGKGARFRRLAIAGVLLHTLFLAIADFEHHDIACHLKTPLHCTSCALSQVSSDPRTPFDPGASGLTDDQDAGSPPRPRCPGPGRPARRAEVFHRRSCGSAGGKFSVTPR